MSAHTDTTGQDKARGYAGLARHLGSLLKLHRRTAIGLELALEKLHMVQLEPVRQPRRIRAAVSLPLPCPRETLLAEPERLRELVREGLARRPFAGRDVVSCMPSSEVRVMTLNYQRTGSETDAAAIVRELRERIKPELENAVVDYIAIRSDSVAATERSAIVAVAQRERVLAYLAALRTAGLETIALDIGPAALARLVGALDVDERHPNALLINFAQERSFMSVIWGRRLILDREFDFCENRLVERLCTALDMPREVVLRLLYQRGVGAASVAADAIAKTLVEVLRPEFMSLAAEVNKTLIYTASKTRGQSVERIYLLGSVARYPDAANLVQELVSIPVEVIDPFKAFSARPNAAVLSELDPIAGIGLATGLALRGSDEHG
jgi:type IV pilus assembly protein PilM